MNKLFYGDNLNVLRQHIPDGSVDLVYLDPPFNSKADYNVLFKSPSGNQSEAQITAFEDTWHWTDESARALEQLKFKHGELAELLSLMVRQFGHNDLSAYLVMMAIRLIELHRVLKSTGSLYLHCDPTASHYLKMILDMVFGVDSFRNEIVWKRSSAHNDSKKFGNIHDVIFFYTQTKNYTWNTQYSPYSQEYIDAEWRELPSGRYYKSENMLDPRNSMLKYDFMGTTAQWRTNYEGMLALWNAPQTEVPNSHGRIKLGRDGKPIKRCRIFFLDEMPGIPLQSLWNDIFSLRGGSKERLGYPTQKPVSLLERIIQASSNPGDIVLDPFCGCGTAVHAAQKLGRQWIGIDITHLAIALIEKRLKEAFPSIQYAVVGTPRDLGGAKDLANRDKYQFQWWACSLVNAQPYQGKKKGADSGIDGQIFFTDVENGKPTIKRIIVSVKGGENVGAAMVRDLVGTMQREKADIGLFVTLTPPTKPMEKEAATAGLYKSGNGREYPRVQILTIEDLLTGRKRPEYWDMSMGELTFKKAQREVESIAVQGQLF